MGFLRQLFGPNQAEVWCRLAEETGSNFVDGGFWRGSKVVSKRRSGRTVFRGARCDQGRGPAQVPVQGVRPNTSSALPPGLGLRERSGDPAEIARIARNNGRGIAGSQRHIHIAG